MTTIAEAGSELITALNGSHACLSEPDADTPAMISGSHTGTGSKPPWNNQAADAYFTAAADILRLEAELTMTVTGHPARPRGGSHYNLIVSIEKITRLTTDEHIVRQLHRFAKPSLQLPAIGQKGQLIKIRLIRTCPDCHIRRQETDGELICPNCGSKAPAPLCPYCRTPNLRLDSLAYKVICYYAGPCTDNDGKRPSGILEVNRLNGDGQIAWNDGLVT